MAQRRTYAPVRPCVYCGTSFSPRADSARRGCGRFCSRRCGTLNRTKPLPVPVRKIVQMYQGGMTLKGIGTRLSLNWKRVLQVLKEANVPRRVGGRQLTSGYPTGYAPQGHPLANGVRTAIHILVATERLGRPLAEGEVVHHVNGIKKDHSPENLVVVGQRRHAELHHELQKMAGLLVREGLIQFTGDSYIFSSQVRGLLNCA